VSVVSLLLGGPVDLIATCVARFFRARVFALGSACLKAHDDGRIPSYNLLGSANPYNEQGKTPWHCTSVQKGPNMLAADGILIRKGTADCMHRFIEAAQDERVFIK